MTDAIEIEPLLRPPDATVQPPGSKSITNRALVCAALAEGTSTLVGALESDDTRVMVEALRQLGLSLDWDTATSTITIEGCAGRIPARRAELFVDNSGTTVRFLTAMVALGTGMFRLDGAPRMRERPIADLLAALVQLGVKASSEQQTGCPPVVIEAAGLSGGRTQIRGDISSQFLSGLLMAAPYAQAPLEIEIVGQLVSQPYIHMTLAVMEAFGVRVEAGGLQRFVPPVGVGYRGLRCPIEPDASAASYFWGAAAIAGGRVSVTGLTQQSLQGDVAFCDCLARMGCPVIYGSDRITVVGGALRGIDVDMNAISDTVQTLSAVALFASGPTRIRGVAHIRHKETDRIGALVTELRKFGAEVEEHADGLTIVPAALHGATIDTYNDHRMAMSLALVGLRVPGVKINDPSCTAKTYPHFFRDLAALGVR